MPNSVIVDAVRSPMGRGKSSGALATVHPVDLLAQILTALVDRNGIDPGTVDDLLVGCVGQNGEQSATPGRQACSQVRLVRPGMVSGVIALSCSILMLTVRLVSVNVNRCRHVIAHDCAACKMHPGQDC